MPTIYKYEIVPKLPDKISSLLEIAYNLWWTWHHDAIVLFRRVDRDLWEDLNHNPVLMLGRVSQARLEELANDDGFLAHLNRVYVALQVYLNSKGWYQKKYGANGNRFAYFSMEFGLSESLPVYSGGLGVLAGDTLKSASDLGLPLVAVGLAYQQGYFRQYLNVDGWQQEQYPTNDFFNLPMKPVFDAEGQRVKVPIWFPHRTVQVQLWRVLVGRVTLYLLDTNCDENHPDDRKITDTLYGGDQEMRIQQEVVLGIGGIRALHAMDIYPTICHMNEGHSAFLTLERIRQLTESSDLEFSEAREAIGSANVFTTHTPVPAGFDIFGPELMEKYLRDYPARVGLSKKAFLALGRLDPNNNEEGFNMALLAGKHASFINGVSKLHAVVTREMWKNQWEGVPVHEIPIHAITNGVHLRTWLSREMVDLLDTYLGSEWHEDPENEAVWRRIAQIPDEEIWRVHIRRRERLVGFARRCLQQHLLKRGASRSELDEAKEVLNPNILTIGFARRFATYKRATLILRNPDRLRRLLLHSERPIQFIFAGKAHPKDVHGKELIKQLVHFARESHVRRRLVFLENYDISVARYLVQGVDVWLNSPRRPLEASGTSGMKAAANAALNVSVLDGWWDEAYQPEVGWAIGAGEDYDDFAEQDHIEANALYNLLENEIVPTFYDIDADRLPRRWIAMMKKSMMELVPYFNTHRMVQNYTEEFYQPAFERYQRLTADGYRRAKDLAAWKTKLFKYWQEVKITDVKINAGDVLAVGDRFGIAVQVVLGHLQPEDVVVQVYVGPLDDKGVIINGETIDLTHSEDQQNGSFRYATDIPCKASGRHGFSARVLPSHPDLVTHFDLWSVTWS
ncbi:MAG: alpha-glucan family phosphorylase [Candidatus Lernaella stagnicola]|nr:alpha-glucan family phosphorylase [Candidatus Lernaella stagnicola]